MRDAKAKCPDLEIVPYNFEAYEQVHISVLHYKCYNGFSSPILASPCVTTSVSFSDLHPVYFLQGY